MKKRPQLTRSIGLYMTDYPHKRFIRVRIPVRQFYRGGVGFAHETAHHEELFYYSNCPLEDAEDRATAWRDNTVANLRSSSSNARLGLKSPSHRNVIRRRGRWQPPKEHNLLPNLPE